MSWVWTFLSIDINPNMMINIKNLVVTFILNFFEKRADFRGSALCHTYLRSICKGVGNRVNITSRSLSCGSTCCVL
jgi:hypothetical protein